MLSTLTRARVWLLFALPALLPAQTTLIAPGGVSPVAALPSTCTVGATVFLTSASAGQNLRGCTATDTWTPQGGTVTINGLTDPGANGIVYRGAGGTTRPAVVGDLPAGYSYLNLSGAPTLAASATTDTTNAGNISSGLLPIARGGTGTASPGLVAGSNITISGSWPNQTIAASGGGGGTGVADPGANGVMKRTSLNTTAAAGYADIVALFGSGSCSGYLKYDGTCATPAGGSSDITTSSGTGYARIVPAASGNVDLQLGGGGTGAVKAISDLQTTGALSTGVGGSSATRVYLTKGTAPIDTASAGTTYDGVVYQDSNGKPMFLANGGTAIPLGATLYGSPWLFGGPASSTASGVVAASANSAQFFDVELTGRAMTKCVIDVSTTCTSCGYVAALYDTTRANLLCKTAVATSALGATGAVALAWSSGSAVSGGVCQPAAGKYVFVQTSDSTTLRVSAYADASTVRLMNAAGSGVGASSAASVSTGSGSSLTLGSDVSSFSLSAITSAYLPVIYVP